MPRKKNVTPTTPAEKTTKKAANDLVTIRGVSDAAKENFEKVRAELTKPDQEKPTNGEVFNEIAARAVTPIVKEVPAQPREGIEEISREELAAIMGPYYKEGFNVADNLKQMISEVQEAFKKIDAAVKEKAETDAAVMEAERTNAKETIEQLTKNYEDLKKTGVFLKGAEFICDIKPEIADAMRLARPFMRRDGRIKSDKMEDFPNEMANVAIEFYLVNKYDHILFK